MAKLPFADHNRSDLAGQFASARLLFGPFSRYAVYAVHTRFGAVQWFVADAETPDESGLPSIIRQFTDPEDAEEFLAPFEVNGRIPA